MRILSVELGWIYHSGEEKEKLIAERLARLHACGIEATNDSRIEHPTLAITDAQFSDLSAAGEAGMMVKSINNVGASEQTMHSAIVELLSKLDRFSQTSTSMEYNERVEVYTPGMGLMLFNRTMLLSDACSDALQSELDNGWRIIAACPQPDQRRPDYILGRFEPNDEPGAGRAAKRG